MAALKVTSFDPFSPEIYCMLLPAVYRDRERMAALFAQEMTYMVRGQQLEEALSDRIMTVVTALLAREPIFQDGSPERIAQCTVGAMHFLQHIRSISPVIPASIIGLMVGSLYLAEETLYGETSPFDRCVSVLKQYAVAKSSIDQVQHCIDMVRDRVAGEVELQFVALGAPPAMAVAPPQPVEDPSRPRGLFLDQRVVSFERYAAPFSSLAVPAPAAVAELFVRHVIDRLRQPVLLAPVPKNVRPHATAGMKQEAPPPVVVDGTTVATLHNLVGVLLVRSKLIQGGEPAATQQCAAGALVYFDRMRKKRIQILPEQRIAYVTALLLKAEKTLFNGKIDLLTELNRFLGAGNALQYCVTLIEDSLADNMALTAHDMSSYCCVLDPLSLSRQSEPSQALHLRTIKSAAKPRIKKGKVGDTIISHTLSKAGRARSLSGDAIVLPPPIPTGPAMQQTAGAPPPNPKGAKSRRASADSSPHFKPLAFTAPRDADSAGAGEQQRPSGPEPMSSGSAAKVGKRVPGYGLPPLHPAAPSVSQGRLRQPHVSFSKLHGEGSVADAVSAEQQPEPKNAQPVIRVGAETRFGGLRQRHVSLDGPSGEGSVAEAVSAEQPLSSEASQPLMQPVPAIPVGGLPQGQVSLTGSMARAAPADGGSGPRGAPELAQRLVRRHVSAIESTGQASHSFAVGSAQLARIYSGASAQPGAVSGSVRIPGSISPVQQPIQDQGPGRGLLIQPAYVGAMSGQSQSASRPQRAIATHAIGDYRRAGGPFARQHQSAPLPQIQPGAGGQGAGAAPAAPAPGRFSRFVTSVRERWTRWKNS